MSNTNTLSLALASPDATAALAVQFKQILKVGDVLLLDGNIGMGKSFFARSLIQHSQDVPEDVPSPTFTIVQTYETRIGEIWHTDLYRLGGPDEVIELGLLEAFETAICLIEWPDRLDDLTPGNALRIQFSHGATEDARTVELRWQDPSWSQRLEPLRDTI